MGKYKQWEFHRILDKWGIRHSAVVLKTDSFEEAFGSDKIMNWLAKNARMAIGLDISPKILYEAKKQMETNKQEWVVANIAHMPFKDSAFDLIFSSCTYAYLVNIADGLKEAYRILKPNGTLVISIRNRHNFLLQLIANFFSYMGKLPYPLSESYTFKNFQILLKEAGFRVDAYEPVVHIFPFLNSLFSFLEKKSTTLLKVIAEVILKNLRKYSESKNSLKYLTAWYIAFKAKKA